MNFSKVKPKHILKWIEEHNSGNDVNYAPCKEDSQEAVFCLYRYDNSNISTADDLFEFLITSFAMHPNTDGTSYYRAFLVIRKDDILNFRLSRHFSTNKATGRAMDRNGKSNIEYHLIVDRCQPTNFKDNIWGDCTLEGTTILVKEYTTEDFQNSEYWDYFINELIYLLTYGNSSNNESKLHKNMKKTITESQLRDMIAESVKKCISELNGYHPTPNTDNNAWRGQKRGEGAIDKDGYPIQKPVQTPKPIGNQKAAPMDDRMKKINESQLQNIISEAVKRTLSEMETNEAYQQYTPNPRQTSLLLTVAQSSNWGGYGNNIAQYHPKTVEDAMNYLSKNGYDTYVLYGTTVTPGVGSGSKIISWGSKGNQLPPSLERLSEYEKQEVMKKRKEI